MVSLFFILFLYSAIICFIFNLIEAGFYLALFAMVILVFLCSIMYSFAELSATEKSIAMYQKENTAITEKIDKIVKHYMNLNTTKYEISKDEDPMYLVLLFPELKSNQFVKQQIDMYDNNNKQIQKLQKQKVELTKTKWLLYFDIDFSKFDS